jgi:hypothetical protein
LLQEFGLLLKAERPALATPGDLQGEGNEMKTICYLAWATVTITQFATGEVVIEVEPP